MITLEQTQKGFSFDCIQELNNLLDKAFDLANIECNLCLVRMKFVLKKQKIANSMLESFKNLVQHKNLNDEYLQCSFNTHRNTLDMVAKTLVENLFSRIEKLNRILWGWIASINSLSEKNLNNNECKHIQSEINNFIELRQSPDYRPETITISSQFKFIRDYFLLEQTSKPTEFSYINFSSLDYIFQMVEDCSEETTKQTMINFLITIPSLFIQFQSIYLQSIDNTEIKKFRIRRSITIPSSILTFIIFVQNKQWKQFSFSNFSYEFNPNQQTSQEIMHQRETKALQKPIPINFSSIQFFFSNEREDFYQVSIEGQSHIQKAIKISNNFEILLSCLTEKLRNALLYFCVFKKLISPLMIFNSQQILYDLWEDQYANCQTTQIYPFLEETFPSFERQNNHRQNLMKNWKDRVQFHHSQSDFIYD